jgi:thioredoxin-like negative regulator of GroEL
MSVAATHLIVYIGAAWCAPCRTAKPALEALCRKFSIPFKPYDYDKDLDDSARETISKVPTVRIVVDGRVVAEYNSNQVAQTEAWLGAHVRMTAAAADADF